MKASVSRGSGFGGVIQYAVNKNKFGGWIAGTALAPTTSEVVRQFGLTRQLRPDVDRPVWHASLALPAGERLDDRRWAEVSEAFLDRMGFPPNSVWVAARHNDTDHDHVHIVASRVALDGKLWHGQWEAYRAIAATQELEREFGLVITPGLGDARSEKRGISKNEIEQALRTDTAPPRQRLQSIVDAAVEQGGSAADFAERLALAGVEVRANLASTGRLNGFSFVLDGIAFKGSQLGASYTWKGLQARGIVYEQARDSERLVQFAASAADRVAGSAQGPSANAPGALAASGGISTAPGPNGERTALSRRLGAGDRATDLSDGGPVAGVSADPGALGRSVDLAAIDSERPGAGVGAAGGVRDRQAHGAVDQGGDGSQRPDEGDLHRDARSSEGGRLFGADSIAQRGGEFEPAQGAGASHRAAEEVERSSESGYELASDPGKRGAVAGQDGDLDVISGGDGLVAWNARFKAASAERKRRQHGGAVPADLEPSNAQRARVDDEHRREARQVDPSDWLERMGFAIKREGRHVSVRLGKDEAYRLTRKDDGHWVACDRLGHGIGDNIALVRDVAGDISFAEAVYQLRGAADMPARPVAPPPPRLPPRVPPTKQSDIDAGRRYLESRRISPVVIAFAERCGFLRYIGGAVLFCGIDPAGRVQNATRRATSPADPTPKRDLAGTDKRVAQILPGESRSVWLVEGGADALALHTMSLARKAPPPHVVVTGGSGVLGWSEDERVVQLLRDADQVVIAAEREKSPEIQAITDAERRRQADQVLKISGKEARVWQPKHGKDLADELVQRELIEARKQEQDQGPTLGRRY